MRWLTRPAWSTAALVCLTVAAACSGSDSLPAGTTPTPSLTGAESTAASAPTTATGTPAVAPSPDARVTLAAAGDVMLGRTIGEGIASYGPGYPLEQVAAILQGADVAFVNLEAPLTGRGEPAGKDFVFRGPPSAAEGLAGAGVDIVSLANNHMLDYGLAGLEDTLAALDAAGVAHAGAGSDEAAARAPTVIERNGLRIAFLGYVNTPPDSGSGFDVGSTAAAADRPGVAWLSPETVAADVAAARREADVVIVSLHTGLEYQEPPSPLQVEAAHAAIDAGAAVVLGGHPHVLQGIETYNGGIIIYSLGNFVFDFDYVDYMHDGLPSALSAVLMVTLSPAGVVSCEVRPAIIAEGDGRPRPAEGADAERVLDRLRRLSDGSCGL